MAMGEFGGRWKVDDRDGFLCMIVASIQVQLQSRLNRYGSTVFAASAVTACFRGVINHRAVDIRYAPDAIWLGTFYSDSTDNWAG